MPRAFEATIPPEYKIMATQVTQYGEPVTQQITPSAYGSYGRAHQDPNDMHQAGMAPEVWRKDESPMKTTQRNVAAEVAYLKNLTRTGQINTPEVTHKEGGAKVVYREMSSDQQVSNVRGMQMTGDPQTLGQALKSAGNSAFRQQRPMDAPRARASMHRATRSMPSAHREAFQEVLARKGPEAFESMAPSALAGLNVQNVGATPSGFVMPPQQQTQLPAQRTPTTVRRALPIRLPIDPRQAAAMKKAQAPRDEGSNPIAFDKLVAEASAKQAGAAPKTIARFHPAASNFEDSTGQTSSPNNGVRGGLRFTDAAVQFAQIKKTAAALNRVSKQTGKRVIDTIKSLNAAKKKSQQAQAQGNTKVASLQLARAQQLQRQLAALRQKQNEIKQGVTAIIQNTVKAKASGDMTDEQQKDVMIQLPKQGGSGAGGGSVSDYPPVQGDGNIPDDWAGWDVGDEGYMATGMDAGMNTSTKVLIGSGVAAALGLGVYMFAR